MRNGVQLRPNGAYYYRRAFPRDLRETLGGEFVRSLRTRDLVEAKRKLPMVMIEFDRIVDRARNQGRPETQIVPTIPEIERKVWAYFEERDNRNEVDLAAACLSGSEFEDACDQAEIEVATYAFPEADFAHLQATVARVCEFGSWQQGLVPPEFWRACALVNDAEFELAQRHLFRLTGRRVSPERPTRFDVSRARTPVVPPGGREPRMAEISQAPSVSLMDTFDAYAKESQPSPATVKAFRRQLRHLVKFLGHDDIAKVTPEDLVRWKDQLLREVTRSGSLRSTRTVRDTYLAAARTTFGYAFRNRRIASDPAATLKMKVRKKVRLRDPAFSDDEARIVLSATMSEASTRISPERARAQRWVPWLCAYTGARVNEMTQLRKEDVIEVSGVWVVRVTPEAGTVKSRSFRSVPIHSHLLDQGFLTMVNGCDPGPLFFNPDLRRGGSDENPQSKKVGQYLANWVRNLGLEDPNLQPNHAWRHRFETTMRRYNIDFEARHVLVGHALPTESGTYGSWDVVALKREIEKLPRFGLD